MKGETGKKQRRREGFYLQTICKDGKTITEIKPVHPHVLSICPVMHKNHCLLSTPRFSRCKGDSPGHLDNSECEAEKTWTCKTDYTNSATYPFYSVIPKHRQFPQSTAALQSIVVFAWISSIYTTFTSSCLRILNRFSTAFLFYNILWGALMLVAFQKLS